MNAAGIDLANLRDYARQVVHSHGATLLEVLNGKRNREASRQIDHRFFRRLGVRNGVALGHRTRQGAPAGGNILQDIFDTACLGGGLSIRNGGNAGGEGETKAEDNQQSEKAFVFNHLLQYRIICARRATRSEGSPSALSSTATCLAMRTRSKLTRGRGEL